MRPRISIRGRVHPSICQLVHRMVPCYFRMTKIAVFEGGKTSNDPQQQQWHEWQWLMSDDEVVASDVPPRYLFLSLFLSVCHAFFLFYLSCFLSLFLLSFLSFFLSFILVFLGPSFRQSNEFGQNVKKWLRCNFFTFPCRRRRDSKSSTKLKVKPAIRYMIRWLGRRYC